MFQNNIAKHRALWTAQEQNHKRDDHLFYLQMFLPESVDVYNISSIRKKKNQTSECYSGKCFSTYLDRIVIIWIASPC